MTQSKILVPVDFSESGQSALDLAGAFAADTGAELLIMHVRDPAVKTLESIDAVEALEALDLALHRQKPHDDSVARKYRLVEGTPAKSILDVAQEEGVELIVMATHGRSGLMRMIMGSVAEAVVRNADCDVVTLRQPETKSTAA